MATTRDPSMGVLLIQLGTPRSPSVSDVRRFLREFLSDPRVLDISGELRGDLYRQGREIAWFMTEDASGTDPNATNTWGAQPHKGLIYASDGSSGLWIVRVIGDPPLHP